MKEGPKTIIGLETEDTTSGEVKLSEKTKEQKKLNADSNTSQRSVDAIKLALGVEKMSNADLESSLAERTPIIEKWNNFQSQKTKYEINIQHWNNVINSKSSDSAEKKLAKSAIENLQEKINHLNQEIDTIKPAYTEAHIFEIEKVTRNATEQFNSRYSDWEKNSLELIGTIPLTKEYSEDYAASSNEVVNLMQSLRRGKKELPPFSYEEVRGALNNSSSEDLKNLQRRLSKESSSKPTQDEIITFIKKAMEDGIIAISDYEHLLENAKSEKLISLISLAHEKGRNIFPVLSPELQKNEKVINSTANLIKEFIDRDIKIAKSTQKNKESRTIDNSEVFFGNLELDKVPEEVREQVFDNEEKILEILSVSGRMIKYIPEKKRTQKIIETALSGDGTALQFLSEKDKDNFKFVEIAIKTDPEAIYFASERLKGFEDPTSQETITIIEEMAKVLKSEKLLYYFNPEIFVSPKNEIFLKDLSENNKIFGETIQKIQDALTIPYEGIKSINAAERGYSSEIKKDKEGKWTISSSQDIENKISSGERLTTLTNNFSRIQPTILEHISPKLFQKNPDGSFKNQEFINNLLDNHPHKEYVQKIIEKKSQTTESEEMQNQLKNIIASEKIGNILLKKAESTLSQAQSSFASLESSVNTQIEEIKKKKHILKKVGTALGGGLLAAGLTIGGWFGVKSKKPSIEKPRQQISKTEKSTNFEQNSKNYEIISPPEVTPEYTPEKSPKEINIPQQVVEAAAAGVKEINEFVETAKNDLAPEKAKAGDGQIRILKRMLNKREGFRKMVIEGEKRINPDLSDEQAIRSFIKREGWKHVKKIDTEKGIVKMKHGVNLETTATPRLDSTGKIVIDWKNLSGKTEVSFGNKTKAQFERAPAQKGSKEEAQRKTEATPEKAASQLLESINNDSYSSLNFLEPNDFPVQNMDDLMTAVTKQMNIIRSYKDQQSIKNSFSKLFSRKPKEVKKAEQIVQEIMRISKQNNDYNANLVINSLDRGMVNQPVELEEGAQFIGLPARRRGRSVREGYDKYNKNIGKVGRGRIG